MSYALLSVFEDWIGALIDKSVPIHVTINCNTLVQKILVLGHTFIKHTVQNTGDNSDITTM